MSDDNDVPDSMWGLRVGETVERSLLLKRPDGEPLHYPHARITRVSHSGFEVDIPPDMPPTP